MEKLPIFVVFLGDLASFYFAQILRGFFAQILHRMFLKKMC